MGSLYFKQALANLRENPQVTLLTVTGTALSVAMMLVLVLVCQVRTASFPPVSERHRILYIPIIQGLNKDRAGFSGGGLGYRIVRDCFYPMSLPEAVSAASSEVLQKHTAVPGNKTVRETDVKETDANFWKLFDFRFLDGKPFTEEMFASAMPVAVISDRVAREFFGTTAAAGRTIRLDFVEYSVTGVVASVSKAVEEAYGEVWTPYSLNGEIMKGDIAEGIGGKLQVFLLGKSPAGFDAIRQEAHSRIATFNEGQREFFAHIWKQPVTGTQRMFYHIQEDRLHGNASGMFSLAALFLFLPVFNLLGIMSVRIRKRASEIGIRKAFGATAWDMTGQILAENLPVTFLGGLAGLLLSVLFFYLAKDGLLERTDVNLQPAMIIKPALFAGAVLTCLLINLLSTALPAWRISKETVIRNLSQK
ncbi:MAG: ABC transporter permease [Tannerella sp.]|jgi:putative ABC transport system permease protein|nr:ABC transporter permease [Tannerella sp.]